MRLKTFISLFLVWAATGIAEHASAVGIPDPYFEFSIKTEWDGTPYTKESPVNIKIDGVGEFVRIEVEAPLYNKTGPPNGRKGQPYPKLWDHEVVEAFFLNNNEQYLEVELSPHGEHLVLMLNGKSNVVVQQLPLQYYCKIHGKSWTGVAYLPLEYFPYQVTKFNAFAIHGEGKNRKYLALYPAAKGKYHEPNFHRLELFKPINIHQLPPFYPKELPPSDLWRLFPPGKHH